MRHLRVFQALGYTLRESMALVHTLRRLTGVSNILRDIRECKMNDFEQRIWSLAIYSVTYLSLISFHCFWNLGEYTAQLRSECDIPLCSTYHRTWWHPCQNQCQMQMRLRRWCRQTRLTKVMSKSAVLICKSPTIALEEGIVESGGELGEMK